MSCAKNVVIVGDLKQLPNVVNNKTKEIILLSTVSDKPDDFMDNANLLNVAISRAENKLIIVVS